MLVNEEEKNYSAATNYEYFIKARNFIKKSFLMNTLMSKTFYPF